MLCNRIIFLIRKKLEPSFKKKRNILEFYSVEGKLFGLVSEEEIPSGLNSKFIDYKEWNISRWINFYAPHEYYSVSCKREKGFPQLFD